jgi:sialate O-acetylesterase
LANFEAGSGEDWARLREKQFECLNIPGTALITAIDCGEYNDVHPQDKWTVGDRLAVAARGFVYGEKDLTYMSPLARRAVCKDGKITVEFDFAEDGLVSLLGFEYIEIETEFGSVFKTYAKRSGSTVVIDCPASWRPKYVRYAWEDNPKARLYSMERLPAFPFRLKVENAD